MYCVFIIYLLLSYRATICYMYINVFRVNSELEVIAAYVLFLSLCVVYWAVVSAKIQPTFAYHQLTSFCITFIFINIAISWAPKVYRIKRYRLVSSVRTHKC